MEKETLFNNVKKELPLWIITLIGSYVITVLLLLFMAFLVFQFHWGETIVDIGIVVIYVLANFLAGLFIGKKKKRKKFLMGFYMGLIYFVVLVLISLICNHGLQDFAGNFFTTMAICVGAGTLGGMLG